MDIEHTKHPGLGRFPLVLALSALVASPAASTADETQVIERLLELPTHADSASEWPEPPPPLDLEPGDTGSDFALLSHWGERGTEEEPSPETRQRLLDAALDHPAWLPQVLERLPQEPEAFDRVKLVYDSAPAQRWYSEHWGEEVRSWLMLNSEHLREELIEAASQARDDAEGGYVEHGEELEALAKIDWDAAAPVLARLVESGDARTSTLALSLQYRHLSGTDPSKAEDLRERLQAITLDTSALGYSRDTAAKALLETEWDGRDAWYLTLFEDPSLMEVHDGNYLRSPLHAPISADPDRWIPAISSLVGSEDRAVHDNAVALLVDFHLDRSRADALRPLLPWLFDPDWSSARDRLRLIQSVDRVGLREAIPGLIHIVETGGEYADWAAESLATFKAPDAIPALRKHLNREAGAAARRRIIRAILACEGLGTEEMVTALHAFSAQLADEEGSEAYRKYRLGFGAGDPLPVEVSLGAELSRNDFEPSEELVKSLVDSLEDFETQNPDAAVVLRRIMAQWSSPRLAVLFLRDLAAAKADADAISTYLARRDDLRQDAGVELRRLLDLAGLARGVAVVLVGDPEAAADVLENGDPVVQSALLASARLVGSKLPLQTVVSHLASDEDALLARAAERYLEALDSREAREALWNHHEGEAWIAGSRPPHDPGHSTFGVFDELEESLREEILARRGPDEIYALLSAGYWGGPGQWILRVRDGRAKLQCGGHKRTLTPDEFSRLLDFIEQNEIDDLPRLDTPVADGVQYEYLHLTPHGGRRIFMNNPDHAAGSVYDVLTSLFFELECS